jgi:uncharacterized protein (TIGR01732 family)
MLSWLAATKLGQFFSGKTFLLLTVLFILLLIGGAYWYVDSQARHTENNKRLLLEQTEQIKQLKKDIDNTKESAQTTADSLVSLRSSQIKVDEQSQKRAFNLNSQLKQIAESAATPEEKSTLTSLSYAQSLRENYCTIKPAQCLTPSTPANPIDPEWLK